MDIFNRNSFQNNYKIIVNKFEQNDLNTQSNNPTVTQCQLRRRECKSTSDDSFANDFEPINSTLIFTNSFVNNPNYKINGVKINDSLKIPENDDKLNVTSGSFGYNAFKTIQMSPSSFGKLKISKERRIKRLSTNTILNDKKQIYKSKLIQAVIGNDHKTTLDLLQKTSIDVNCFDDKQRTPLHIACSKGSIEIVRILLDFGADPNIRDCVQNLPIHLAIINSNVPIVTLLLEAGTDIESLDLHGKTVLHLAGTRLRWLLNDDNHKASPKLKLEAIQIMNMIKEYLKRKQQSTDELDILSDKFENVFTMDDINQLTNQLLNKFANFNINS